MMRIHKKVQQGQMPIADVVKTVCHDKYANVCRAKGQISFAPDIFLFYPSTKHRTEGQNIFLGKHFLFWKMKTLTKLGTVFATFITLQRGGFAHL